MNPSALKEAQLRFLAQQSNPVAAPAKKSKKHSKPIASQIKEILECLDPHKGKTAEDIKEETGIDITENQKLHIELTQNPFVNYSEPYFYYKPRYTLKNRDELLDQLRKTPEGIDTEDLKDSYKGIEDDIQMLVDNGKIHRLTNRDNKHEVVFPIDERYKIDVFPEFQSMWAQIRIPDDVDLEKEMQKAGLTMMEQAKPQQKRPQTKKKAPKPRKLRKITNVHLGGITDVNPEL